MSRLHEISCKNCGGSISLNEEWDRTPNDFRPGDWVTRSCVMCGGLMNLYTRWINPPKAHNECMDGRWHEQPCSMCFGPMALPAEVEAVPKFHPRCVPQNWYERACELCEQPLKIHVDWEDPPTAHRNCGTVEWYEKACRYCGSTLKVHVDWENPPSYHEECRPLEVPDEIHPDLTIDTVAQAEVPFSSNGYERIKDVQTNGNGNSEIVLPDAEAPVELNGSAQDKHQVDDPPMDAPPEEILEAPEETVAKKYDRIYFCSQCGKQLVDLDEFHPGSNGSSPDADSVCHECEYDTILVSGAVAALEKQFSFAMHAIAEIRTRTVTENITVVKNSSTKEVVAEVKVCEDGIFSVERAAVAYDPNTDEPYAKTVFHNKGFFSALRTVDTFDREGKLIQHTRPGQKLALEASNDDAANHPLQFTKNRFFFKRR